MSLLSCSHSRSNSIGGCSYDDSHGVIGTNSSNNGGQDSSAGDSRGCVSVCGGGVYHPKESMYCGYIFRKALVFNQITKTNIIRRLPHKTNVHF